MSTKFEKIFLGKTSDNEEVYMFAIHSKYGSARISSYGASIQSIIVPDKFGNPVDVVLGFDNLLAMENQNQYIGSIIGRCASRIKDGEIIINDKVYRLTINEGKNHLHGGNKGFHCKVWKGYSNDDSLIFERISPDGEEGYPGNVKVRITYRFDDSGLFSINYYAKSDQDTIVNLTSHAYFNLSGHDSGDITNHMVKINSNCYYSINEELLSDGHIASVKDTPMDFNMLTPINKNINSNFEQIKLAGGFDHNYILSGEDRSSEPVAIAISPETGIVMEVFTDMPAMQFYTGNNLNCKPFGKGRAKYRIRSGFCMETQNPSYKISSGNDQASLLKAGEIYSHFTHYKFSTL